MCAASAFEPAPPIRLRDPRDVVGVIPTMLGFHPSESLVLLCLGGERSEVLVTVRADLPLAGDAVGALTDRAERAGAASIVAVVYCDQTPVESPPDQAIPTLLPQRALVDALTAACDEHQIDLLDALLVARGRWWSYFCAGCCPGAGTALDADPGPEALRLRAEAVARGARVWPSREALADSIAAPALARRAELTPVFERADAAFLQCIAAGEAAELRAETLQLLRDLHVRYRDGVGAVDVELAARVTSGLSDVRTRDAMLEWSGGAQPGELLALLTDVVRQVPPPHDPAVSTALAWVAYQAGDGALARCAIDRALASDPAYNLALLLEHALDRALNPSRLADVFAGTTTVGSHGEHGP